MVYHFSLDLLVKYLDGLSSNSSSKHSTDDCILLRTIVSNKFQLPYSDFFLEPNSTSKEFADR